MDLGFYEGKKVLITGGAGFIGSHLAEELVKLGSDVHIADNLSRGSLDNISHIMDKVHFHQVDLTKMENCVELTQGMDCVFHLAASVGGIHFITREHVRCLTPDIMMHVNMLESCRINDVEFFLFTSSACIYRGKNPGLNRFREDEAIPANPPTTYGWAKLVGELLCKSYYTDYGIRCSIVRIFNAYGERENLDPKWSHVIPSLIRKAILYPKERFIVFGDGKQERAFLYVKDCVKGLLLAMVRAGNADPINLGSEELVSIGELAKKIIAISGKDIKIEYDLSGPVGVSRYCADTTKMRRVLGWSPRTPLDLGLKRTYEWAEKKLLGGRAKWRSRAEATGRAGGSS